MPTPSEIALQLQNLLPLLTDRFHDELPVTGAEVSGGILTISFASAHNLAVNRKIFINEALIRNEITSVISNADGTVSYITANTHDLTAYSSAGHGGTWPEGLAVTLELPAETSVTLVPDESGVPHENEFVGIEGSPVFIPSGSEYLLENRSEGVVGFKTIATVPDPTSITVDLSDVPDVPDGAIIISNILTNIRVSIVANVQRAEAIYTKQTDPKAYLFVVMLDRNASKNRANSDDFTSLPGSSEKFLNLRQEFSTLVIVPTENNLGAGSTKDFVYTDLFSILLKCLYGWQETGYISDGESIYNSAFYAHAFDWESRQQINFEDGFLNRNTVALRHINWTQVVFDEGESDGQIDYE